VPFEPTPGRGAPNEGRYLGVAPAQDTGRGGGTNTTVTAPSAPSTVVTAPANPTTTQPRVAPTNAGGNGRGAGIDLAAWSGLIGLVLLGGALAYLLLVPSLLALRRRRRRDRARDPGSRVRLAWSESEEALELIGQARRPDETAREFAGRAGERLPTQSRGLLTLASVADAALFGADTLDESVAASAEETTQAVQAIVDDQVPRWRRALNQFDARRLRRPPPG
jgi:hypothetical protein